MRKFLLLTLVVIGVSVVSSCSQKKTTAENKQGKTVMAENNKPAELTVMPVASTNKNIGISTAVTQSTGAVRVQNDNKVATKETAAAKEKEKVQPKQAKLEKKQPAKKTTAKKETVEQKAMPKAVSKPKSEETVSTNRTATNSPKSELTTKSTANTNSVVTPNLVTSNPVVTNPVTDDPSTTNRIVSNLVTSNPVVTNPVVTTNPVVNQPIVTKPVMPAPAKKGETVVVPPKTTTPIRTTVPSNERETAKKVTPPVNVVKEKEPTIEVAKKTTAVTPPSKTETKQPITKPAPSKKAGITTFFNNTNTFMRKYVKNGLVAYTNIKKNKGDFDNLVKQVAETDLTAVKSTDKQAFYINAYNILVIKSLLDHSLPKSPLDVSGFFNAEKHEVAGQTTTLDVLEKQTLFGLKKDARFHFVVVCGAKGCPQLENFAYQGDKLEGQLQQQTKKSVNDKDFIQVKEEDKKVLVSEIFKWYEKDFTTGGKSVIDFLNQYRTKKIPTDYSLDYYDYDWNINKL